MKVKTIIGQYAYAVIEEDGRRTDIQLQPGHSASNSLRQYAAKQRAAAQKHLALAALADRAAAVLDAPEYLTAGETLWNGKRVTAFFAATYNHLTDMIEEYKRKSQTVPEHLLLQRHSLIAAR